MKLLPNLHFVRAEYVLNSLDVMLPSF